MKLKTIINKYTGLYKYLYGTTLNTYTSIYNHIIKPVIVNIYNRKIFEAQILMEQVFKNVINFILNILSDKIK